MSINRVDQSTSPVEVVSLFEGYLNVNYISKNRFGKPLIVFVISDKISGALYEAMWDLLDKCGTSIVGKAHSSIQASGKSVISISGFNGVMEAINVLLDYIDLHNITKNNPEYNNATSNLNIILNEVIDRKNQVYKAKQKTIPPASKDTSKNTKVSQSSVRQSLHEVERQKTLKGKIVFTKSHVSAINEIESFNSELYRLLLGPERVGKVRPVYNSKKIRKGSTSVEVKGYISIGDYAGDTSQIFNSDRIKEKLISGGCGKVEVANHVFAEDDGHYDNVGFNDNGEVSRIDFDNCLHPVTSRYHGLDPFMPQPKGYNKGGIISPIDAFPVNKEDMISLPDLIHTKPFNGTKFEFNHHLLSSMQNDSRFINDKWYTYLKYLLINDNTYKVRLDYCISSKKRKEEIFIFLQKRRNVFKSELFQIPEFIEYILKNPNAIKNIINEFNDLNKKYDSPKKQNLKIDIDEVSNDYLSLTNELSKDYHRLIAGRSYPESYAERWNKNNAPANNISLLINDYINPKGGWFLSGHWDRGNIDFATAIIDWISKNQDATNDGIRIMLEEKINKIKLAPGRNAEGSFVRRLEFCLKQILTLLQPQKIVHQRHHEHKQYQHKP